MRKIGMRKDHRFDSDGQIKAVRGREVNEVKELISEQLKEVVEDTPQIPDKTNDHS